MQVTITIPDELAARAQERALQLDRHVSALLEHDLADEVSSKLSIAEAIDNIVALRKDHRSGEHFGREHSAGSGILDENLQSSRDTLSERERNEAVDRMLQFAARHGYRTKGNDLKQMLHEGHKY